MIRRPPRSTRVRSSAASDVYKRQVEAAGRPRPTAPGQQGDEPAYRSSTTGRPRSRSGATPLLLARGGPAIEEARIPRRHGAGPRTHGRGSRRWVVPADQHAPLDDLSLI